MKAARIETGVDRNAFLSKRLYRRWLPFQGGIMMAKSNSLARPALLLLCSLILLPVSGYAQNQVMGEVIFTGATKVDRSSGVWIDGQYVGHVNELKGNKKILLLPGGHEVVIRQTGYHDLTQKIVVEPGKPWEVTVRMEKNPQAQYPSVTSEIKLQVTPNRAAVFVDDAFAGYVHEFGGRGRKMLLSPGKHHIKIGLAGYQDFETTVDLLPRQKITIKSDLIAGSITQAGTSIKKD
jgi:PEGA domain